MSRALATLSLVAVTFAPALARACPMCFDGGNSNSQAFVWGSLLLMFVPTFALGTLGYLAYRRIKAADAVYEPQVPEPAPVVGGEGTRPSGEQPVLRS